MNKICRICDIVKPLTDFSIKKDNKDGHDTMCKSCKREDNIVRQRASRIGDNTGFKKLVKPTNKIMPARECDKCLWEQACCYRVQRMLPVMCEIPDVADMRRAKMIGVVL